MREDFYHDRQKDESTAENPVRVAIIGGGPGGLFSAWHLAAKLGTVANITIFEADGRLGGKIVTRNFPGAGLYEAGVAEIYDYSHLGPDPLRDLIQNELDLPIKHIDGGPCVLQGKILQGVEDLEEHFGRDVRDAAAQFRERCASLLSPHEFYKSVREGDNKHCWGAISGEDVLANEIQDETARRFVRVMSHSDVAAAPHLTNGLNLLKNVLMDVDGYLKIYSVVGGNEEIVRRLIDELDATVCLDTMVRAVEPLEDGTYRLNIGTNGSSDTFIADYVIVALPLTALSGIEWRGGVLQRAIAKHASYFDRPGHYLRVTLLFERPFWREHLQSAWWMLDAFDGCCVYDEGARHDLGKWGALGFLIAGNAAMDLSNMSDERIERLCLDALPPDLHQGRDLLVDRRVHRWMASVNAVPGGYPLRSRVENHRPDANNLPGIFMVGDYLFDATLNGVLDSADTTTDMILADVLLRRRQSHGDFKGTVGADVWFKGESEEIRERFFAATFLADLLKITWGLEPGSRILNVGSGEGTIVAALRAAGFDAVGVENYKLPHKRTPDDLRPFNLFGELTTLPFADDHFDAVVDTGLCRVSRDKIPAAIAELRRVSKRGVILGSVPTDLAIDLLERYNLLAGVKTLASRWDWAEFFYAHGFDHALSDPSRLDEAWKRAQAAGAGPGHWYEDAESLLYCVYEIAAGGPTPAVVGPVGPAHETFSATHLVKR